MVIIRALKRFAIYSAQEESFATLSSDMLRKFSKFLENEHKFVVEGKDGKPRIKDPLYKAAYKSVPECRFPKQRGQNSIIGTMSRFHTFVRWAIKRGYMNRDPYDDYVIGTAIYGTPFYLTKEERNNYTRLSSRTTLVLMSNVTSSYSNALSDAASAT